VDLPQPESPTNATDWQFIYIVKFYKIFLDLSLGYAKVTWLNLNIPFTLFGLTAFKGDLICGYLSIILYILAAAALPSVIFFMAGVS